MKLVSTTAPCISKRSLKKAHLIGMLFKYFVFLLFKSFLFPLGMVH